jgi:hypothetical protein
VDASSDRDGEPLVARLTASGSAGWMAATPGEQLITVRFHAPQDVARIRVVFTEVQGPRTQELTVWATCRAGATRRELARQQFTFGPAGPVRHVGEYEVGVAAVSVLELRIVPDVNGARAYASVQELRVA